MTAEVPASPNVCLNVHVSVSNLNPQPDRLVQDLPTPRERRLS